MLKSFDVFIQGAIVKYINKPAVLYKNKISPACTQCLCRRLQHKWRLHNLHLTLCFTFQKYYNAELSIVGHEILGGTHFMQFYITLFVEFICDTLTCTNVYGHYMLWPLYAMATICYSHYMLCYLIVSFSKQIVMFMKYFVC